MTDETEQHDDVDDPDVEDGVPDGDDIPAEDDDAGANTSVEVNV